MKYTRLRMSQREELDGYGFILPWLVGFILYAAIPFFFSLRLSVSKIMEFSGFKMSYIGWQNYARALFEDISFVPMFLKTIRDTVVNTAVIIVVSMFFAILLNRDIKLKGIFRGAFFLPVLLGTGYIMQEVLGQTINIETMTVAGGMSRGIKVPTEFVQFLGPTTQAMFKGFLDSLTVVLWKSGVQILLFLAGLQGISSSLYEAAYCDGATEWEMFWDITLPMISPIILLNVIYSIIDSFTDSSNPIVNYILQLNMMDFGYAAAIGWIYFVFIIILVATIFMVMQKFIYNSGQK